MEPGEPSEIGLAATLLSHKLANSTVRATVPADELNKIIELRANLEHFGFKHVVIRLKEIAAISYWVPLLLPRKWMLTGSQEQLDCFASHPPIVSQAPPFSSL